jgi:hypothetical protein
MIGEKMYKIFTLIFAFSLFSNAFSQEKKGINSIDCFSFKLEKKDTSIDEILNNISSFESNNCAEFNFGINDNAVWIKLELDNLNSFEDPLLVLNSSSLDYLYLYSIKNQQIVSELETGRLAGIESRLFKSHKILFKLSDTEKNSDFLLIKIENSDKKIFTSFLIEEVDFNDVLDFENILFGLLTGVFIGLFFYNFFLYLSVKDKIYLVYVLHTILCSFRLKAGLVRLRF